ncbi:hypothetical protein ROHU_009785 [Labeo rohita]|uniref:Uncharacterized protein n=1 Tax=Labeo rohita TaxID=84645 RepID=A0A498M6U6_LABRO|nr:hypothetical protein ROHU_009785 [Labeo rohita]
MPPLYCYLQAWIKEAIGMEGEEAGQRVQPILSRSTVASIVRLFRNENRIHTLPHTGGRGKIFRIEQESAIVDMRIMEFEAEGAHHKFIFVDEASFNLCKVRRRGRNIIGQRATVTVSGQRGANITMCSCHLQ